MKCFVCNGPMFPSFKKDFVEYGLMGVEYEKCQVCGFVASKTIAEMSDEEWSRVNRQFHIKYQGTDIDPNDPKWLLRLNAQADTIADLTRLGLLPTERQWLDYGCGDGKLSGLLDRNYGLSLLKFDPYMTRCDYVEQKALQHSMYSLVVCTSVLEHMRSREQLDAIASLVAGKGVLGIHTLVAEQIPTTAEWFYALPVHCFFFTNKSMQLLFKAWGYVASIYNYESRLWFWFKSDADKIEGMIQTANKRERQDGQTYHFKRAFMDYWKLDAQMVMNRT